MQKPYCIEFEGTLKAFQGSYAVYSRLSLSRSRRDPLKHFEISVVQHIRFAELRISLRDKRLFEITEVEITRVDCISSVAVNCNYSIGMGVRLFYKHNIILALTS